jgi:two-component system osmolarity sensor histidine kinase EnvZ
MRLRLKNYLPRSLFGRAALILILPIVATQLVVSVIFIQRHFEGVTRQLTQGVMIEMRLLMAEIAAAPDAAAAAELVAPLASRLAIGLDMSGTTSPPTADVRGFWDLSGRSVLTTLRNGMPGLIAADLATDRRRVAIWLASDKGPVAMTISRSRLSATNPHQLLVVMVLASVLLTLIAYVFLRNQLTPITRLARAAEAFGRGETLPYRPRGATEVRAAGNAFLDMRARIERQIEQRTLMLSGVSHDLRAPLTRLKLGLSFLPEDDEVRALIGDVSDMERLVDEFLAFVRGDAMEETVATDPVDLVVKSVENAQRLGQVVMVTRLDTVGQVRMRPDAVARALDNLIGNAARYGTRAEVSLLAFDRSFRIVVEDDGPGIPRDRREEALLPFTRLDPARDPNKGGGVGLGLSIAADIARSHGGSLRLGESEILGGLKAELVLAR